MEIIYWFIIEIFHEAVMYMNKYICRKLSTGFLISQIKKILLINF